MLARRLGVAAALLTLAACSAGSRPDEAVDATEDQIAWEPISTALGNPPNFAQLGNGSTMSVVSRAWGRGAKAGALVELYYPHYDSDNLWDSYLGIQSRGSKLRWAHDLQLKAQRIVPDTGRVVSELEAPGFSLTIEDVLRPKNDAHLRRVFVHNTGKEPLEDVRLAFYAFYTIGNFPGGDQLRFDAASGALVQRDDDVGTAIATVADRPPSVAHCGLANWIFGGGKDARIAAENDELSPCTGSVGPSFAGVNGVLAHRLDTIAPGASKEITYAIGLGPSEERALSEASAAIAGGFPSRAQEDADHWAGVLARADVPKALPPDAQDVYRRAIITVMQHRVDNGAFIAAPTLTSPVYKLIWPRDGSKTAVDMLEAGFAPEAKAFFEFLETLLKPDGSFAINYKPATGAFLDLGSAWNENDQPGMLAWGVERVFEKTGDEAWSQARWPAVRKTAEHLLSITNSGLVEPSRDLWELETGGSWTYASASALAGLEAAAKIARRSHAESDADRYVAHAEVIRRAMAERLVTPEGFFGRGLKDGQIDGRLEIANLALGNGGFGLFPDTDPRIARIGDLVAQRLGTPGGAVRRYEGDRYYGGQPWPVASAWLSIHRLGRNDRAGAEALFRVMTDQAHATETLMLGEQFDESKKAWLSAMPLVWSEAAYIRNARALYGSAF
jgi:GH15 family glucan-1,4-alpha-glucosidase